jgi:hypothetical protein
MSNSALGIDEISENIVEIGGYMRDRLGDILRVAGSDERDDDVDPEDRVELAREVEQ